MGRFSSLQDETIHQILAGLRSHTQVAQLKTLSKKWLKIVSAYPVLEFFEEDYDGREESHWRICAEVLEKFSRDPRFLLLAEWEAVCSPYCAQVEVLQV
ncbi:hypothetical protein LINPERHAP2_LOCUS2293 [Linum perenne]